MIEIILTFLITIYALTILASGVISLPYTRGYKVFCSCPLVFLINLQNTQLAAGFYLLKVMLVAILDSAKVLFSFSNHFIITLDIAFLFSTMLLILFHTLKLPTATLVL